MYVYGYTSKNAVHTQQQVSLANKAFEYEFKLYQLCRLFYFIYSEKSERGRVLGVGLLSVQTQKWRGRKKRERGRDVEIKKQETN